MNRSIDKRLTALEARVLRPAIDTKLCIDGFDVDEYQRLVVEVTSHDGWFSEWQIGFREWARDQQVRQKGLIFDKGWIYERH